MLEEKNLNGELLTRAVKELVTDDEKRKSIENNVREFAVTDTLDRIYATVRKMIK